MMRIGWVDYSREEKNRITSILRLLGTQGAVDELGIGTIRDYYSNRLFPGITVLQTRAKYFVLIPYLFADAQQQKYQRKSEVLAWINKQEDGLVKTLIEATPKETGVIGSNTYKQGRTVKMKPSSIYWNGLRTAGILRHSDFSISDACEITYLQSRKRSEISLKAESEDSKGDDVDMLYDGHLIFEPIRAGYNYLKDCTIYLKEHEAAYIRDKFILSPRTKDSLMAFLLQNREAFDAAPDFANVDSALLPDGLRHHFEMAKQFSDFIVGAHLLYNRIYANGEDKEVEEDFRAWLEHEYYPADIDAIIRESDCPKHTALFIKLFDKCIAALDLDGAMKAVVDRERFIKHDRAKLLKPGEFEYNPEARIHYYRLDFRYSTAKRIIQDIFDGLEKKNG